VEHWYDHVYLPVIEIIRQQGILRSFPGRTETDLYLWIAEHRAELEEELGWQIKTEYASIIWPKNTARRGGLIYQGGRQDHPGIYARSARFGPAGWMVACTNQAGRPRDRLFTDLLVPVDGQEGGWLPSNRPSCSPGAKTPICTACISWPMPPGGGEDAQALKSEFEQRCQTAGISGQMGFDTGRSPPDQRSGCLGRPGGRQPGSPTGISASSSSKLGISRPGPALPAPHPGYPQTVSQLQRAWSLSTQSKAHEALYIAAYLSGQWRIPLLVVSAGDSEKL